MASYTGQTTEQSPSGHGRPGRQESAARARGRPGRSLFNRTEAWKARRTQFPVSRVGPLDPSPWVPGTAVRTRLPDAPRAPACSIECDRVAFNTVGVLLHQHGRGRSHLRRTRTPHAQDNEPFGLVWRNGCRCRVASSPLVVQNQLVRKVLADRLERQRHAHVGAVAPQRPLVKHGRTI